MSRRRERPARIEILDTEHPAAFVVRVAGHDQSYVDLDDPTRLAFDYVRRMGDVIDAAAPTGTPLRAVHVGGAGLTLPRYLATTRPGSAQVVLEPDEDLTAMVRERLPLPRRSGIKVRPVDGQAGVVVLRDGYADLVVLDAYEDGAVPLELLAAAFLADVARVLAPGGLLLLNLVDGAPFARTRQVVAGLRASFGEVVASAEPATLRGRRAGNLLLVAGTGEVPVAALTRSAATSAAPYRVLDAGQVLASWGGGRPL